MPADLNVVVLAAGEGKRLTGQTPKVLTPLWGVPALCWPVDAALGLNPRRLIVVAGPRPEPARAALAGRDAVIVTQERAEGTGAAVLLARSELDKGPGPLLVLFGDGPLVDTALLERLLDDHAASGAAITVLTADLDDPAGYGRVLRDERGALVSIVEERDADPATRAVREINSGVWVIERSPCLDDLSAVGRTNAQAEVYLTDLVAIARERGRKVGASKCADARQVLGFNDQRELAAVRALLRRRILERHLLAGVEIVDPESTWIDATVSIEPGARILPATVIEGRCRIAAGCEVGPFAHLRTGTELDAGAEVGNFTETKQTRLGAGAKAKHLSYLGDATIGARANIGAGTITANYDGRTKHPTTVGERAFIGSGTVLVAPVSVGDQATTGAGAIVTRHSQVGAGETWVGVPARKLRGPGAKP
jgi:bifunctional UDP-N-acetylglucosamine pyrophosphorylase/glucosamine-1-phosphate N-acetyltransferase